MVCSNTKKLLPILALLTVFLAGCGSSVTPISDETQIKNKIGQYYAAISAKNWDLAKSCCYPGSEAYLYTEQAEVMFTSFPQYNDAIIWVAPTIYSIDIQGNEATVELDIWVQIYSQGEYEEQTIPGSIILIKSGGEWYLYY